MWIFFVKIKWWLIFFIFIVIEIFIFYEKYVLMMIYFIYDYGVFMCINYLVYKLFNIVLSYLEWVFEFYIMREKNIKCFSFNEVGYLRRWNFIKKFIYVIIFICFFNLFV